MQEHFNFIRYSLPDVHTDYTAFTSTFNFTYPRDFASSSLYRCKIVLKILNTSELPVCHNLGEKIERLHYAWGWVIAI